MMGEEEQQALRNAPVMEISPDLKIQYLENSEMGKNIKEMPFTFILCITQTIARFNLT